MAWPRKGVDGSPGDLPEGVRIRPGLLIIAFSNSKELSERLAKVTQSLRAGNLERLPPTADELQYIDRERILEAQKREALSLADDPLICGVDQLEPETAWEQHLPIDSK
jgi:hypothetical protein